MRILFLATAASVATSLFGFKCTAVTFDDPYELQQPLSNRSLDEVLAEKCHPNAANILALDEILKEINSPVQFEEMNQPFHDSMILSTDDSVILSMSADDLYKSIQNHRSVNDNLLNCIVSRYVNFTVKTWPGSFSKQEKILQIYRFFYYQLLESIDYEGIDEAAKISNFPGKIIATLSTLFPLSIKQKNLVQSSTLNLFTRSLILDPLCPHEKFSYFGGKICTVSSEFISTHVSDNDPGNPQLVLDALENSLIGRNLANILNIGEMRKLLGSHDLALSMARKWNSICKSILFKHLRNQKISFHGDLSILLDNSRSLDEVVDVLLSIPECPIELILTFFLISELEKSRDFYMFSPSLSLESNIIEVVDTKALSLIWKEIESNRDDLLEFLRKQKGVTVIQSGIFFQFEDAVISCFLSKKNDISSFDPIRSRLPLDLNRGIPLFSILRASRDAAMFLLMETEQGNYYHASLIKIMASVLDTLFSLVKDKGISYQHLLCEMIELQRFIEQSFQPLSFLEFDFYESIILDIRIKISKFSADVPSNGMSFIVFSIISGDDSIDLISKHKEQSDDCIRDEIKHRSHVPLYSHHDHGSSFGNFCFEIPANLSSARFGSISFTNPLQSDITAFCSFALLKYNNKMISGSIEWYGIYSLFSILPHFHVQLHPDSILIVEMSSGSTFISYFRSKMETVSFHDLIQLRSLLFPKPVNFKRMIYYSLQQEQSTNVNFYKSQLFHLAQDRWNRVSYELSFAQYYFSPRVIYEYCYFLMLVFDRNPQRYMNLSHMMTEFDQFCLDHSSLSYAFVFVDEVLKNWKSFRIGNLNFPEAKRMAKLKREEFGNLTYFFPLLSPVFEFLLSGTPACDVSDFFIYPTVTSVLFDGNASRKDDSMLKHEKEEIVVEEENCSTDESTIVPEFKEEVVADQNVNSALSELKEKDGGKKRSLKKISDSPNFDISVDLASTTKLFNVKDYDSTLLEATKKRKIKKNGNLNSNRKKDPLKKKINIKGISNDKLEANNQSDKCDETVYREFIDVDRNEENIDEKQICYEEAEQNTVCIDEKIEKNETVPRVEKFQEPIIEHEDKISGTEMEENIDEELTREENNLEFDDETTVVGSLNNSSHFDENNENWHFENIIIIPDETKDDPLFKQNDSEGVGKVDDICSKTLPESIDSLNLDGIIKDYSFIEDGNRNGCSSIDGKDGSMTEGNNGNLFENGVVGSAKKVDKKKKKKQKKKKGFQPFYKFNKLAEIPYNPTTLLQLDSFSSYVVYENLYTNLLPFFESHVQSHFISDQLVDMAISKSDLQEFCHIQVSKLIIFNTGIMKTFLSKMDDFYLFLAHFTIFLNEAEKMLSATVDDKSSFFCGLFIRIIEARDIFYRNLRIVTKPLKLDLLMNVIDEVFKGSNESSQCIAVLNLEIIQTPFAVIRIFLNGFVGITLLYERMLEEFNEFTALTILLHEVAKEEFDLITTQIGGIYQFPLIEKFELRALIVNDALSVAVISPSYFCPVSIATLSKMQISHLMEALWTHLKCSYTLLRKFNQHSTLLSVVTVMNYISDYLHNQRFEISFSSLILATSKQLNTYMQSIDTFLQNSMTQQLFYDRLKPLIESMLSKDITLRNVALIEFLASALSDKLPFELLNIIHHYTSMLFLISLATHHMPPSKSSSKQGGLPLKSIPNWIKKNFPIMDDTSDASFEKYIANKLPFVTPLAVPIATDPMPLIAPSYARRDIYLRQVCKSGIMDGEGDVLIQLSSGFPMLFKYKSIRSLCRILLFSPTNRNELTQSTWLELQMIASKLPNFIFLTLVENYAYRMMATMSSTSIPFDYLYLQTWQGFAVAPFRIVEFAEKLKESFGIHLEMKVHILKGDCDDADREEKMVQIFKKDE